MKNKEVYRETVYTLSRGLAGKGKRAEKRELLDGFSWFSNKGSSAREERDHTVQRPQEGLPSKTRVKI